MGASISMGGGSVGGPSVGVGDDGPHEGATLGGLRHRDRPPHMAFKEHFHEITRMQAKLNQQNATFQESATLTLLTQIQNRVESESVGVAGRMGGKKQRKPPSSGLVRGCGQAEQSTGGQSTGGGGTMDVDTGGADSVSGDESMKPKPTKKRRKSKGGARSGGSMGGPMAQSGGTYPHTQPLVVSRMSVCVVVCRTVDALSTMDAAQ